MERPKSFDSGNARRVFWHRFVTFILIAGICVSAVGVIVVRRQRIQSASDEFHLAAASAEYAVRQEIESHLAPIRTLYDYVRVTPTPPGPDYAGLRAELKQANPGISMDWVPGNKPVVDVGMFWYPVFDGPRELDGLRGYVRGSFKTSAVLEKGLSELKPEIDVEFFDVDAVLAKQFLYQHPLPGAPLPYKSAAEALKLDDFKDIRRFKVADRDWVMVVTATRAFKEARRQSL
jgi:hypothetical protein